MSSGRKNQPPVGFTERLYKEFYRNCSTKQEFANAIKVERKSAYNYLDGSQTMDILTLARCCYALGVSADYLLFGKEDIWKKRSI